MHNRKRKRATNFLKGLSEGKGSDRKDGANGPETGALCCSHWTSESTSNGGWRALCPTTHRLASSAPLACPRLPALRTAQAPDLLVELLLHLLAQLRVAGVVPALRHFFGRLWGAEQGGT